MPKIPVHHDINSENVTYLTGTNKTKTAQAIQDIGMILSQCHSRCFQNSIGVFKVIQERLFQTEK